MPRNSLVPIFVAALSVAAAAEPAHPPAQGSKAPDFSLKSFRGEEVQLSSIMAKSPVVLVVLRGYPGYQCPFCSRQVQDFVKNEVEFAKAGVKVVMVYPGPTQDLGQRANEFLQDKNFPVSYEMLLDPDYKFTNLYGLRWDAPKETAYPSTFVLDKSGVIRFEKVSGQHGDRTTASEILEAAGKK
jgi:peroxiredoxin